MSPQHQRALGYTTAGWQPHRTTAVAVREPVVVVCAVDGCPSTLTMPAGTPERGQATRLEVADWTYGPAGFNGPVCGVDHTWLAVEPPRPPWWQRWFGGGR